MKPSLYAAKMTPDCAICYVADTNFTLPTLVSATGLRKFVPPEMAPIYVFLIDDDGRISELSRFLAPYHIRIVSMSSSAYSNFDRDQLNRSHVPAAALGRFCLEAAQRVPHRRHSGCSVAIFHGRHGQGRTAAFEAALSRQRSARGMPTTRVRCATRAAPTAGCPHPASRR